MTTAKILLASLAAGLVLASPSFAVPPSKAINPGARARVFAPIVPSGEHCPRMFRPWTAHKTRHFVACRAEKHLGGALASYCRRHCA